MKKKTSLSQNLRFTSTLRRASLHQITARFWDSVTSDAKPKDGDLPGVFGK